MAIFRRQRAELPSLFGKKIKSSLRKRRRAGPGWRRSRFEHLESRHLLTTVGVQFEFANTIGGAPLSSLSVGQNVVLETFVQDVRSASHGVFQGWLNVNYDSSVISVNGTTTHGPHFSGTNASEGASTPGHLVEIGGDSTDATPPNPTNAVELLFAVPFHVDSAGSGTLTLTPSLSSDSLKQFIMFQSGQQVSSSEISFSGTSIPVAATAAHVTSVSTTKPTETYGPGTLIPITVTFDQAVTVAGTPELALNDGGVASYASGSTTNTLTFNYTVAAGQNTSKLDYTSTTALTLNGGSIKNSGGLDADLTLAAPGADGLAQANIAIDTTSPTVSGVASTATGTFGIGASIPITITFNEPVTVTGTPPQLALNSGGGATATYTGGSTTNTLTFTYTVAAGQSTSKLDYTSTSALTVSGGAIKDAVGNDATLTLPPTGADGLATRNIVIDTSVPAITAVATTTASGTYTVGTSILIRVTFNQIVTVTGAPQLALNDGGVANFTSGSNSNTLTFTYMIAAGQNTPKLDYASTSALTFNGGSIKNSAMNDANLTLPAVGGNGLAQANIIIDTAIPTVTAVSTSTPANTYGAGASIPITITFSEPVLVTGTPQLTLNAGNGAVANYVSGAGGNTLTFNYTVAVGQNSSNLDYTSTFALSLNNGTIRDAVGNDATLTLPHIGTNGLAQANIVISAPSPSITSVSTTTPTGTYGAGTTIPIRVAFNQTVIVTGAPRLALNDGGVANFASGSNSNILTFNYTVAAGQNTSDLDYATTTALTLNGGTIKDTTNDDATLTLPATGSSALAQANIVIDTTGPTVSGVATTTATGTYGVGTTIPITVSFNEPVTVTGAPRLALNDGGFANFASGNTTNTLTFNYTVAAGQNTSDLDCASTSALGLNGGTIKDSVGNNATLTLPATGNNGLAQANIAIDTTGPTVSGVSTTAATRTYGIGASIPITITFNDPVTVTGTPRLALNSGGGAVATYASGSTSNTLTFTYTVAAGQSTSKLDYTSTSALDLNGGTIKDAVGNDATLTLPPTGADGLAQANIAIDTISPTVTAVSTTTPTGKYAAGTTIPITVTFTETVNVTGTPQLVLNDGGMANFASGDHSNTLTFNYTVAAGQNTSNLDYASTTALALNGGSIKDASLNDATLTLPTTGASGLALAHIAIDTANPAISDVSTTTATGTYGIGALIPITITFNEPVNVTGTPHLALNANNGAVADYASGTGTTALTFNYTVAANQSTPQLDYTSTSALTLGGGSIKDSVGNDAVLALLPTDANGLANKNIVIDAIVDATVTQVATTVPTGLYIAGQTIPITLQFSKLVTVTGTPQLGINAHNGAQADYTSGSGTNTLTFVYTVMAGDGPVQLDFTSTDALSLNGGTIQDSTNGPAILTLPAPGAADDALFASKIFISTAATKVRYRNSHEPTLFASPSFGTATSVTIGIQGGITNNTALFTLDAAQQTSGDWSATVPPEHALEDGYYVFTAMSEPAGNTDTALLVIDTTIPAVSIDSPIRTNQPRPSITGTAADNGMFTSGFAGDQTGPNGNPDNGLVTVQIFDSNFHAVGAPIIVTPSLDPNHPIWTWTASPSSDLADGVYHLQARAVDNAGNGSLTALGDLVVDNAAPVVTIGPPSPQTISGTSRTITGTVNDPDPSSGIQSAMTVMIMGVTDSSFMLTVNGTATGTAWTATVPSDVTLPEGSYFIAAKVTDNAGNQGSSSTEGSPNLDVDTDAPTVTVDALTTTDTTPTLTGNVTESGSGVQSAMTVMIMGVTNPNFSATINGTATSTGWTATVPDNMQLPAGNYFVVAKVNDGAGNQGSSPTTGAPNLTVDTTAPIVGVNALTTNDTTPTLTGTVTETLTGVVNPMSVMIMGVTDPNFSATISGTISGSNWSATVPDNMQLPAGNYFVVAKVNDGAGNQGSSPTTGAPNLTIDTTAPTVSVNPLTTTDTTPTLTGGVTESLSGVVNPISVMIMGVTDPNFSATISGTVSGSNWSATVPDNMQLPAGNYFVVAKVNDGAGNQGSSPTTGAPNLTVDTTAPIVGVNALTTNDTTPTLTGTVTETLTGVVNPMSVMIMGVTDPNFSATISGTISGSNWSATVPDNMQLPAGNYFVVAKINDGAGNQGSSPTTGAPNLTIDTTAPTVSVNPLTTTDTTPTLTGAVTESLSGVVNPISVMIMGVTDPNFTATISGTVSGGTWSAIVPDNMQLPDGAYFVVAKVNDGAGNQGSSPTAGQPNLIVDTVAPQINVGPPSPQLFSGVNRTLTGTVNDPDPSSGIQSAMTVMIVGVTNPNFTTTVNGTATSSSWTATLPTTLPAGSYFVIAKVTDIAGNQGTSPTEGAPNLVGDADAPTVTVNPLDTSDTTPALTGTVSESGSGVQSAMTVMIMGVTDPNFSATINGTATSTGWTATVPDNMQLPAGNYFVVAKVTDGAGNQGSSPTTGAPNLTIDTTAPTVSVNPLTTTDTTPMLTGAVTESLSGVVNPISVMIMGVTDPNFTATISGTVSGGTWSAIVPDNMQLPAGNYFVVAKVNDGAGNQGSSPTTGAPNLTVDTTAPIVGVNALTTNDTTPTLTGTVTETLTGVVNPMSVMIMGVTDPNFSATISGTISGSNWSATVPDNMQLPAGNYFVVAKVNDGAGNQGSSPTTGAPNLTIDTTAPTVSVNPLTTTDTTPTLTGGVTQTGNGVQSDMTVTISGVSNTSFTPITVHGTATSTGWTATVPDNMTLPAGTYFVVAHVTDNAGNTGNSPSPTAGQVNLTVDVTAPAVTVNTLTTSDTTPALTGGITETGSGVQSDMTVTISGVSNTSFTPITIHGTATATGWTATVPDNMALPIGTYFVVATVTDNANNQGSSPSPAQGAVNLTITQANASISGFVYYNPTNDGNRHIASTNTDRLGISGVTVTLQMLTNGTYTQVGSPITTSSTAGSIGAYSFTGLADGTYKVVETQPSSLRDGTLTKGTINGTADTAAVTTTPNQISNIVLPASGTAAEYNFSERGVVPVSKRGFLASTPPITTTMLQQLVGGTSSSSSTNSSVVVPAAVTLPIITPQAEHVSSAVAPSIGAITTATAVSAPTNASSALSAGDSVTPTYEKLASKSNDVPALVDQVLPKRTSWLRRTLASWRQNL